MPVKNDRQYRVMMPLQTVERSAEAEKDYIVHGYATTFEPYEFFTDRDGQVVYEHFTADSFEGADMSDVIMQYDHSGRVYARQSNGTLKLSFDEHGLAVEADLGRTELSRQLHEDISEGMITKMSWGFIPAKEPEYDRETHTLKWGRASIGKVFDVSAVSIPANGDTNINARSYADGVISAVLEEVRRAEQEQADEDMRRRMRMKLKLMEF